MKCRYLSLIVFGWLLLIVSSSAQAGSVLMTNIQYWLASDYIQTVMSFDRAVTVSYHHRSNPARFVVEIPQCEHLWGDQKIPVNDRLLQQVRVQRLSDGTMQVVFDLAETFDCDVDFHLDAVVGGDVRRDRELQFDVLELGGGIAVGIKRPAFRNAFAARGVAHHFGLGNDRR